MHRIAAALSALALVLTALMARPALADEDPPAGDWDPAIAAAAAERVLGEELAGQVEFLSKTPEEPGIDSYRVWDRDGVLAVAGTTPAVALRGLNDYLGEYADMSVSWNGNQVRPGEILPLPDEPLVQDASVPHRFALNDTDDGYSGAYRTLADWQELLDVLAFHGFNELFMPVGAEKVYLELLQRHGYTEAEALAWIPQPAHQPWWLLQNMHSFPSPISANLVDARAELGRDIADAARELGITPVLPGYFGTVPADFASRNPGANVVPQGHWPGFVRPGWLDPTSSAFAGVAADFYDLMDEHLGASDMYKMDLLHEGGTPGAVDVSAAAAAVQDALGAAHPGAIWAILGWQHNPPTQLIAGIDTSRMLIVDGLSDRHANLQRTNQWQGTPFAFGSIWNFGGHTTMGAWTELWNTRFWEWKAQPGTALSGIAMLPEGSYNNPFAMDRLASLAWTDGPGDVHTDRSEWADRRYGAADPSARLAWQTLGATAYGTGVEGWSEAQDSLFTAQPSLTATRSAAWSPTEMTYNATRFAQALPELLAVPEELRSNEAYAYDVADVARQALANHSRELLPKLNAAYVAGDVDEFRTLADRWLEGMDLLEEIAATNEQTLLGPWIERARAMASSPAEADLLEEDARALLSYWGGSASLVDYANREWSGLISTYYEPRWEKYLDALETALVNGTSPATFDWRADGVAWSKRTGDDLLTAPQGDPHEVATRIAEFLDIAPLEPPAAGEHYLSDLDFYGSVGGYGPWERDMHNGETAANDGGPISIAGSGFDKGLGGNSPGWVEFLLGGQCQQFTSVVGIDDTMDKDGAEPDVIVRVIADGVVLHETDVLRKGESAQVDVDVTGATVLRLDVDQADADNWWDRVSFGDPVVSCTGPTTSPEPTEEPALTPQPTQEPTLTSEPTKEPTRSPEPTPTPTGTPTDDGWVYRTPGVHQVNGRLWFTECEPYSQTTRCTTDIWATHTTYSAGVGFVSETGWTFNNLTYLPSERSLWADNPLGHDAQWISEGRHWRTECDTAVTGRNGCRSWVLAATPQRAADGTWTMLNKLVFNNIVLFG